MLFECANNIRGKMRTRYGKRKGWEESEKEIEIEDT